MSNRSLVLISCALFLIVIVEGFYLISYKKNAVFYNSPRKIINKKNNNKITNKVNNNKSNKNVRNVNRGTISYLSVYDKSILLSSVITNKFKGKISEIYLKPGIKNSIKYEKGFILESATNPEVKNLFLLRAVDIPKTKVFSRLNGNLNEIDFSNFSVGDIIEIEEQLNIFANSAQNRIEVKIIKQ